MTGEEARALALLSALVPGSSAVFLVAQFVLDPELGFVTIVPFGLICIWSTSFALRMDWPQPLVRAVRHTQSREHLRQAKALLPARFWRRTQALRGAGIALSAGAFGALLLTAVLAGRT